MIFVVITAQGRSGVTCNCRSQPLCRSAASRAPVVVSAAPRAPNEAIETSRYVLASRPVSVSGPPFLAKMFDQRR